MVYYVVDGDYIHFSFVVLYYDCDCELNDEPKILQATKENYKILYDCLHSNDEKIKHRWKTFMDYVLDDIRGWVLSEDNMKPEWFCTENRQIYLTIDKNKIEINMSGILRQYTLNKIKQMYPSTNYINEKWFANKEKLLTAKSLKENIEEGLWKDTNEGEMIVPGIGNITFCGNIKFNLIKLNENTNKKNRKNKPQMY